MLDVLAFVFSSVALAVSIYCLVRKPAAAAPSVGTRGLGGGGR